MKANVFVRTPDGYKAHFEVNDDREGASPEYLMQEFESLMTLLVAKGYTPESPAWVPDTTAPVQQAPRNAPQAASGAIKPVPIRPADDRIVCPDCGGETEYHSGTSQKTGKPWAGWFCVASKDYPDAKKHQKVWV